MECSSLQQFLTAIEKVDLSNNAITDDSTGIEVHSCMFIHYTCTCAFVYVHVHICVYICIVYNDLGVIR